MKQGSSRAAATALVAGYLLIAVLPLLLAAAAGAGHRPGLQELGSAVAMVGFAVLLLEFVLSGRFAALTDPVGMDVLMRFHQFSGHVVLVLLIAHPLLYAVFPVQTGLVDGRIVEPRGGGTLAGVTGFLAWFLLILLVFAAVLRDQLPLRYETWRVTHGLGAALVALLGLVHTLEVGGGASVASVRVFWIAAVVLALATLLHVYGIKPWLKGRRPWRVARVDRLAPEVHQLTLEPDGHDGFAFRAGQFVWLRIAPGPWGMREHPFSIASAPGDGPALRFVIKANGDFTRGIGAIEPGARAWIDGPYGRFGLTGSGAEALVFIAGGVGLAPILSLLRERMHAGDRRPMRLVYASRWRRDLVLETELRELARHLDLETVTVVDEADRPEGAVPGPVDRDLLERTLPPVARERIACSICAPPGMIDAMETALVDLGVPHRAITSERFRYRYGAASPVARRVQRVYAGVAGVLALAVVAFSLAG
ncbi:MAG: ferric reductase-like transmembrane domain-containing protein [Halofilum sp. (in: g-proteobacteria)]|nr:ferric reductase-like transmembrane domain-containing protein [Halofilum sp. (in: g-proteobacteria)]